MATSESDDFESADEELGRGAPARRNAPKQQWITPSAVDSESDDGAECITPTPYRAMPFNERSSTFHPEAGAVDKKISGNDVEPKKVSLTSGEPAIITDSREKSVSKGRPQRGAQQHKQYGAKKLGTKLRKEGIGEPKAPAVTQTGNVNKDIAKTTESKQKSLDELHAGSRCKDLEGKRLSEEIKADQDCHESLSTEECVEMDMPEELKSAKTFKEVFKPQGWESIGNDIELPDDLSEDKLQPVLERLSLVASETEDNSGSWGSWGTWGVSSLINTATAGVSTLTSHVSHGFSLLEESIGVPDPAELAKAQQEEVTTDGGNMNMEQIQPQSPFTFSNLLSGVSSITKLVESTGSKVVTGGLDTLEAIGKKTMEVLQEGDPGLKKKRAFFLNEADKPILSQILREAKEKADAEEKTLEEKQFARKVHFESLFDDYQGLVHLEALEMLSKQSNLKIQQHLIGLESSNLTTMQETLEEVKELCDLGDEDDDETEETLADLKVKLADACQDLSIDITYEKLCNVCEENETYLASLHTNQELYQSAISTLARFTALSVERFHKTAELLLIKERRNTVNEADALVHLARRLSSQIGLLANSFCNMLNESVKTTESENSDNINTNITAIFFEASNASSYIQEAFRLLIPIVQVGVI